MGTVAYMSPEQVQAQAVDARSDIFSFGVVLYELLARRHPFRRETVAATLTAILQETPPELGGLDAAIPPAVDGIVRRCLEKRREERFQTAHDLALALEAVLAAPTGSALLEEVEEREPVPGASRPSRRRTPAVFFGREAEVEALWEKLRPQAAARGDRALGGGQDVVPAGGRGPGAAGGVGGARLHAGGGAPAGPRPGARAASWPATPRRCGELLDVEDPEVGLRRCVGRLAQGATARRSSSWTSSRSCSR